MEITASRTGEHLVLSLSGRMDGTGAQQVTAAIQQNLTDHDTDLVFDLGGVDYLSSAGLRVFQENARRMKERNGRIVVCRLQDFVKRILASGGFFRILAEFPDVPSALAAMAAPSALESGEVRIAGTGWSLAGCRLAGTPGILTITGDLTTVEEGKISPADIREVPVPPRGFCAGIGAVGPSRENVSPLLGDMLQAGGMVSWIPTDGTANPDFFTAGDLATSGMKTFLLYGASFSGPFSDLLRITAERPEGMTLADVYEAVFRYAREQYPSFSGACAVCLKATLGGLASADIRQPILAAAAERAAQGAIPLPAGKTMSEYPFDHTLLRKASAVDIRPRYTGEILISVGYGIDPQAARAAFGSGPLASAAFADPRSAGAGLFLYNKGLVFSSLPWDNARPFEEQFRTAPAHGRISALHNLLAVTTVRSAVAGILPVSAIRTGP